MSPNPSFSPSKPSSLPSVDSSRSSKIPLLNASRSSHSMRPKRDSADTDYLFKYIIMTQIVVYFEAGAVPAILNELREVFFMSFLEQGALGGVVYLFLSLACPIAGLILPKFSVRLIMGFSLLLNALSTLMFSLTPSGWTSLLIISRAFIGFSQAFLMVYSPIWVDEFAPKPNRTRWMSYLQSSVPMGVMIGYAIATGTGMMDKPMGIAGWRLTFLIQASCTLPLAFGCFFVPESHLNIKSPASSSHPHSHQFLIDDNGAEIPNELSRSLLYPPPLILPDEMDEQAENSDSGAEPELFDRPIGPSFSPRALHSAGVYSPRHSSDPRDSSFFSACLRLSENRLFLYVCLALSGLYFVVTGLQFWVTDYLITSVGGSPHTVRLLFVLTAATSPVLGVLFGGWFVDRQGGYDGHWQRLHAIDQCILFGVLGFVFSVPVGLMSNLYGIFTLIWLLLFFGGCVLPAATGVMIQSVRPHQRPFASSLSVILFNLFGYFLSPVLSGFVMNQTNSMIWGFRLILWFGAIPIVSMIAAHHAAKDLNHNTNGSGEKKLRDPNTINYINI